MNIGIMLIVTVGLSGWGVCKAEEEFAPSETIITATEYPATRTQSGAQKDQGCVNWCNSGANARINKCIMTSGAGNPTQYTLPGGQTQYFLNKAKCTKDDLPKSQQCIANCPTPAQACAQRRASCLKSCDKETESNPKWLACKCLKGPDGIYYNCTSLIILRCRLIAADHYNNECLRNRCTSAKLCK